MRLPELPEWTEEQIEEASEKNGWMGTVGPTVKAAKLRLSLEAREAQLTRARILMAQLRRKNRKLQELNATSFNNFTMLSEEMLHLVQKSKIP